MIREWDLRQVIDVDRAVFPKEFIWDFATDWFHFNSLAISPTDKSIVVSGRNQGVVIVDWNNELKWILAPHQGWVRSGSHGDGFDARDFLLTAVDSKGDPLPVEVQLGPSGTADFEWPTGQHAPSLLGNGNLLLFDNGLSRDLAVKPTYSRAVEYAIDEQNRTIHQVWQYGKERGLEMSSGITSDVDVLETARQPFNCGELWAPGYSASTCKMIEVTYPDNEVVFDANIFFKDGLGTKAQEWAQFRCCIPGERYFLTKP